MALVPGRIVRASVLDPNDRNRKARPVVLLEGRHGKAPDEPLAAVAVTTRLPRSLPPEYVVLRWQRGGHPQTGLDQPAAAVCSWIVEVHEGDGIEELGTVPPESLAQILHKVSGLSGASDQERGSPS